MQSLLEEKSIQGDKSVKRELICERQGKSIYQSDKPDFAIQVLNSNGITEEGKHIPTNAVDALRIRFLPISLNTSRDFTSQHILSASSPMLK